MASMSAVTSATSAICLALGLIWGLPRKDHQYQITVTSNQHLSSQQRVHQGDHYRQTEFHW